MADFKAGRRCAAEILFEPESVSRSVEESHAKGKGVASALESDIGTPKHRSDITGRLLCAYSIAGNTIDRQIQNGANGKGVNENVSFTLNTVDRHAVAYGIGRDAFNQGKNALFGLSISEELQPTIVAKGAGAVFYEGVVRRLTPKECERLQGLPDNYTLIDDKTCSDTARYKALGNGMAQPCADFVIRNIVNAINEAP